MGLFQNGENNKFHSKSKHKLYALAKQATYALAKQATEERFYFVCINTIAKMP